MSDKVKVIEYNEALQPIEIIEALNNADKYIHFIFMYGSCYQFHLFLKTLFPDAKAYISCEKDHVVTKISSTMYDVRGVVNPMCESLYRPLEEFELKIVEAWSFCDNNSLKLKECEFCEEPILFNPKLHTKG